MIHYFDRSRIEVDHIEQRFMAFVSPEPMSGCWLWLGTLTIGNSQGYGRFTVDGIKFVAHQISWRLWRGAIPTALFVLHKCDNRQCVNPDHLFLGTYKDNAQDRVKKGRCNQHQGCDNYMSSLTPENVIEIRKLRGVVSQRRLARMFGIAQPGIGRIQRGDAYKNVSTLL